MTQEEFEIKKGFPKYLQEEYIHVSWDDYKTGQGILGTDSLGPCLGITLYNPETKKGALAHIDSITPSKTELYPKNVIDTLLKALDVKENHQNLEASLAEESISFIKPEERHSHKIKKILAEYKIPVIGEDLEYHFAGKLLFLNCKTGKIESYHA